MQPPHLSMLRQLPVTFCSPISTMWLDLLFRSEYICLQSLSILPLLGNGLRLCTSLNIISFKHLVTEKKYSSIRNNFPMPQIFSKWKVKSNQWQKWSQLSAASNMFFVLLALLLQSVQTPAEAIATNFAPIILCKILHLFFTIVIQHCICSEHKNHCSNATTEARENSV